MPFGDFYRGRKVLVTGHTGFKGSWLSSWLLQLGADVYGVALEPETNPALFDILELAPRLNHRILDIRDRKALAAHIADVRPDVVFHLAAQPIVRLSYRIPVETIETNVLGVANLLHAVDLAGYEPEHPCRVVVVTSDKCYENRETYLAYREEDPMGGHDIYSAGKGMAELLTASWRRSFHSGDNPAVHIASCRAGNVIGGGDWSPDRIVVDCIEALRAGRPIQVRNPASIRPWQHVLEPLSGYLQVGALLGSIPPGPTDARGAWNFGPGRESERTVADVCDALVAAWGEGRWEHTPEPNAPHEARFLKLSIDKAWHFLEWQPVWDFAVTVANTAGWYRLGHECGFAAPAMRKITETQLIRYMEDAAALSLRWTRPANHA